MVKVLPLPSDAAHSDCSTVLLDDPVRLGQTQPGTFANGFGGEERIENVRQDFGWDSQHRYHALPGKSNRQDVDRAAAAAGPAPGRGVPG